MTRTKSGLIKFLDLAKNILPFLCVAVFALCWILHLVNGSIYGHHFNGQPPEFWKTLEIITNVMLINACVFTVSFPVFMFVRPLPAKHKALRIILRIVITLTACAAFLFFSYISAGSFVGFGG